MPTVPVICTLLTLSITAIAAVTDARTGHIPNWLTVPAIAVAPFLWLAHGGLWSLGTGSLLGSLGSLLLCALVPLLLFKLSALGMGDVKLFAAIGALTLARTGIEALFYACCAMTLFACAKLAWDGKLLRTLMNALFILVNPILPAARRRPITTELLTRMRFGVAIFVGTVVAVLANNQSHGLL